MKSKCKVKVEQTVAYDVEFAGPQVNVVEVYFIDGATGSYTSGFVSLPRDVKASIINQIVADARDKDRDASLERPV